MNTYKLSVRILFVLCLPVGGVHAQSNEPCLQASQTIQTIGQGLTQADEALRKNVDACIDISRGKGQVFESESWAIKGSFHLVQNQYAQAITAYQKMIEIDPSQLNDYWKNISMANAYRGDHQYRSAQAALDRAQSVVPESMPVYFTRAMIYGDQGLHEQAIASLTAGLASQPTFAGAYFQRAKSYEALGDLTAAKADLKTFDRLRTQEWQKNHALIDVSNPLLRSKIKETEDYMQRMGVQPSTVLVK